MHKMAKEIMDRIKSKINSCGIDAITEQELIEMKYWTCVADCMTSFDYHYRIIEEMEKPENEYGKNYDEGGRYYTQPRDSMGRYTSRGYEYDPVMRSDMQSYRDMDMSSGRMYYTDMSNMGSRAGNSRGYSEGRYERARRGFEDAKEMHPEADNMEKIQEVFTALEEDMKELKPKMSATEKSFAKNKFVSMSNMI